jgi:hypothetical protein
MLNSYGLQATVDVPTRIGSTSNTAIDQIILNKCLWDYNFKVIATGYSDHYAQILLLQIQGKNKRQASFKEELRLVRSCKEENVHYLNYLLGKEDWELAYRQPSVNEAYNEFISIFRYYYDMAMPKKWSKSKQLKNKWVTPGIRVSCNKLRFLNNLIKIGNVSEEIKEYYSRYKKIYNRVIRDAKRLANSRRINTSGNKSKAMWDLIKEELGVQNKSHQHRDKCEWHKISGSKSGSQYL